MTKKNYAHIELLVDESGSMQPLTNDVIGGINAFIEEQAQVDGTCTVSLTKFGTAVNIAFFMQNVNEKPKWSYLAHGGTALLDAIGETVDRLGTYLKAKPEDERPDKVFFVIYTDGEENSSRVYTAERIKQMTQRQATDYDWDFVYLGANQDAFAVGSGLGIGTQYSYTPRNTYRAARAMSSSIRASRIRWLE